MCELARAHLEAVTLCAGLQRHFGRRSTSASRSEPREPLSWYRGREAVRHQAFELQLDLMTLENRTDQHAACWDRAEFAELPDAIQQQHDEGTPVASKSKCKWPQGPFSRVALIAAKCSRMQAKRRSTIREVLPELEVLVAGLGGSSRAVFRT